MSPLLRLLRDNLEAAFPLADLVLDIRALKQPNPFRQA